MKKILFTISGLQFQKDEGAKNRLNSFLDSYKKKGYAVDVLFFYSLLSIPYFLKRKNYLNPNANWYLIPTLPISHYFFLSKLTLVIEQFFFYIISRLKTYNIIQAEVRGDIGKFKPEKSTFIVDFHGDSVAEAKFKNNNLPNWFTKYLLKAQKESLNYADHVIAVSENLIKILEKNTDQKIINYTIISCGVDLKRFQTTEKFKLKNKEDKIIIGYLGGLTKWQNIEAVLDITIELHNMNRKIFFVLFTNSIIDNTVQQKLDILGKENFYIKALKFAEVPKFLKLLDAGFLIRDNLSLNIVSSPTKTAEYLAAGIPVICTQFSGDYQKSIRHGKEGFVLKNIYLNPKEVKYLNSYLINIKENRGKYRKLCSAAAKKRTWETEFNTFFKEINPFDN